MVLVGPPLLSYLYLKCTFASFTVAPPRGSTPPPYERIRSWGCIPSVDSEFNESMEVSTATTFFVAASSNQVSTARLLFWLLGAPAQELQGEPCLRLLVKAQNSGGTG